MTHGDSCRTRCVTLWVWYRRGLNPCPHRARPAHYTTEPYGPVAGGSDPFEAIPVKEAYTGHCDAGSDLGNLLLETLAPSTCVVSGQLQLITVKAVATKQSWLLAGSRSNSYPTWQLSAVDKHNKIYCGTATKLLVKGVLPHTCVNKSKRPRRAESLEEANDGLQMAGKKG